MRELSIRRPDDWHVHLRDGAALAAVREIHRRAIRPRDRDAEPEAAGHHRRQARAPTASASCAALPAGARFEPLMTLYLTDTTPPDEIDRAAAGGIVRGVKLYPAGATTHSEAGVTDIAKT